MATIHYKGGELAYKWGKLMQFERFFSPDVEMSSGYASYTVDHFFGNVR